MAPTRRPTDFAPPIYRFDEFELHTRPTRLLARGAAVALQPQPARALELLLQNAGRVVSREQLKEHIWGGESYLDHDQGINFAIRKIRMALDDDAGAPRFVETVPRVGYRFLSPVTRAGVQASSPKAVERLLPDRSEGLDTPVGSSTAKHAVAVAVDSRQAADPPSADARGGDRQTADLRAADSRDADSRDEDLRIVAPRPANPPDVTPSGVGPQGLATSSSPRVPAPRLTDTRDRGTEALTDRADGAFTPTGLFGSIDASLRARRWNRLVPTVGALFAALIVTWALARPNESPPAAPTVTEAMLAIAPFEIVGVDTDTEPLGVAVHELLTRRLAARLGGAPTVLASSTVRRSVASDASWPALGADYVLRARLARHGDRLHLTLRLEPTAISRHLWAGTFEPRLDELPAWYDEVANHVAQALQTQTVPPPSAATLDPLPAEDRVALLIAYGRLYQGEIAASRRALRELETLAARLPSHAFAHAALAEAHWRLRGETPHAALPAVEAAARHALELDAELASAHLALCRVARLLHHDWETAEREAQRAVELAPGWHPPLLARAALASSRGQHEAARRDLEQARRLDPLGPETRALDIALDYFAGRSSEAIEHARDTLELYPYHRTAHDLLVRALLAEGRDDEALQHLGVAFSVHGQPPPVSLTEALARQREAWRAAADAGHPVAAEQALWAALAGDRTAAQALLERACVDEPAEALSFAMVEPAFAPLRRRRAWRALADCLPPPADAPAEAPGQAR